MLSQDLRAHSYKSLMEKQVLWATWDLQDVSEQQAFLFFCHLQSCSVTNLTAESVVCKSNWEQSEIHWIWHASKCHPVGSAFCQDTSHCHPAAAGVSLISTHVSNKCSSIYGYIDFYQKTVGKQWISTHRFIGKHGRICVAFIYFISLSENCLCSSCAVFLSGVFSLCINSSASLPVSHPVGMQRLTDIKSLAPNEKKRQTLPQNRWLEATGTTSA